MRRFGEFVHDLRWQATVIALAIFVLISGSGSGCR